MHSLAEIFDANFSTKKPVPEKKSTTATSTSLSANSISPSLASKAKPKVIPQRPRGM